MRYWDASALVPLLVEQARSTAVLDLLEQDPGIVTWWATRVECVSALARIDRELAIPHVVTAESYDRLDALASDWREVAPASRLRSTSERLLRTHPLRAADALQLAAAIAAADDSPRTLPFVTLDERLARAAEREGFPVIEPA